MTLWWRIRHQFWDFSRLVGMRDRLRCPYCSAVGTWKPHGGWLDGSDVKKVRRWLCKWCGIYDGWDYGRSRAVPSLAKKCWVLEHELPTSDMEILPKDAHWANPWAG